MSIGILIFLLQVAVGIHAIKTGRMGWLWIILMFPGVGVLIYFVVEVVPDLRSSYALKKASGRLQQLVDPTRDLRRNEDALEVADTVENRLRLAQEHLEHGNFDQAETLFQTALSGIYATDPVLLLGLAHAQFGLKKYADTTATLNKLKLENPTFRSQDGHLLYARALEQAGDTDAALHEFEALSAYALGFEAKALYAQLLMRLGREAAASAIWAEIIRLARQAPKHVQKANKQWIALAESNAPR